MLFAAQSKAPNGSKECSTLKKNTVAGKQSSEVTQFLSRTQAGVGWIVFNDMHGLYEPVKNKTLILILNLSALKCRPDFNANFFFFKDIHATAAMMFPFLSAYKL